MRKKYHIEGIDCANCAAKVEKKMNELPDVEVTLTFATSQLMVRIMCLPSSTVTDMATMKNLRTRTLIPVWD